MSLSDAETSLYRLMGSFSTVAQVSFINASASFAYASDSYRSITFGLIPSQCAAFLTSNFKFIWFIESWEINRESGKPVFTNKKVYPAKVEGLNIPYPRTQTFKWRDGLIDNSFNTISPNRSYFRPGFGQTIPSDLSRPFLEVTVTEQNYLGLGPLGVWENSAFAGPFGRLMAVAATVDEELAAKYDASTNKKKKKSLNSQDYEEMPTYPAYTPYQSGGY